MLTREGCRARRERFLTSLEQEGLSGALISHPRDIYYFTGVLPEHHFQFPNLLFLGPGRPSWLVTGVESACEIDEVVHYSPHVFYTFNPDNHLRAASLVRDQARALTGVAELGFQREALPHSLAAAIEQAAGVHTWRAVDELLQEQQLRKDPDEVDCIRAAIAATLAGYDRAQQLLRPGITELEVSTQCQAAAQLKSGRVHFYSGDFQSGCPGGFARRRPIEAGELYIIDAWSDVGGYWSDMSRTWSVGGEPTDLQQSVFEHLAALLRAVPGMVKPGGSTMEFWRAIDARIREHPSMAADGLTHHGGHGIGLRGHEGPDLNRDRGGVFEVGNVFTVEPGFYSAELRGGVRVENNFLLSEAGVVNLSEYPLSLLADPRAGVAG